MSHVACRMLHFACCMLHVACRMLQEAAADLAPAGYLAARQRSVRAMRAAHRGYRLQDNTLFLAVAYFDRVWLLDRSLHAYGPAELQQNLSLIALVCLMLASKMEEVHACFALDLAPYFFAGAALDSESGYEAAHDTRTAQRGRAARQRERERAERERAYEADRAAAAAAPRYRCRAGLSRKVGGLRDVDGRPARRHLGARRVSELA